jgi:hypothetical protein
MSCLNCFKKPFTMGNCKTVTFNDTVTVIYFKQTPIELNVNWQQVARDRYRFKRRTLEVDKQIGWVFAKTHRKQVYRMIYGL